MNIPTSFGFKANRNDNFSSSKTPKKKTNFNIIINCHSDKLFLIVKELNIFPFTNKKKGKNKATNDHPFNEAYKHHKWLKN